MNKIAIITFYYGRFGKMMDFWFKSVANTPTINFLMFTDLEVPNKPDNLKVVHSTFKELISIAQKNFDFEICVPEPYKFPDFRPAFGEIFHDYLDGYEFWGFCDTDLVFGNIRHFITDDIMSRYDKILSVGHFTLYRNIPEVNAMYKKCEAPSYKQVYTFPRNSAFEEYFGTSRYWDKHLHDRCYQAILFDDIDCYVYPFESQMRRRVDAGKSNFIYSYEDGTLYRVYELKGKVCKDETMYVHFQKRRMEVKTAATDRFTMVPNAFISYIEDITLDTLHSFDVSKKIYWHKYKLQWNMIKNKWAKVKASHQPSVFGVPQLPQDGINYYIEK